MVTVSCPHCRFPITGPHTRVHTGTSRVNGTMIDHRPAFHPECARQHLITTMNAYTKARANGRDHGLGCDPATGQPTTLKETA